MLYLLPVTEIKFHKGILVLNQQTIDETDLSLLKKINKCKLGFKSKFYDFKVQAVHIRTPWHR